MHGLDVDDGLRRAHIAVIAGELAAGAFLGSIAGVCEALDHNLGEGGNRQAHKFGFGHLYRSTH